LQLNSLKHALLAGIFLCLVSCSAPPIPPEIKQAEEQNLALWRAGAPLYMTEEYKLYMAALTRARTDFIRENNRLVIFRNYTSVRSKYKQILQNGDSLISQLEPKKQEFARRIEEKMAFLHDQIGQLKVLSERMNEGRLARRDLIQAEVSLIEAGKRCEKDDFAGADEKTAMVAGHINAAEKILYPLARRYSDEKQIVKWQQWFHDTLAESRTKSIPAIVVNKSERTLTLYKNGSPQKSYKIGLGRNDSRDKLHAGDYATPEGKYRIIKKLPQSRYHKALLINYPNEDDREQFGIARQRGLIPRQAGIGGLIEIHGGGKDSMTYGCIAMDNPHIGELYNMVAVGTPVTIIGAVDSKNRLSSALQGQ
jgi:hypothetical protein